MAIALKQDRSELIQNYPGCQRYFFSLGATELSGEAAKASRGREKTSGTNG